MEDATPVDVTFTIPIGDALQPATVFEPHQADGTQLLLIHNDALFGVQYLTKTKPTTTPDNALRFIFFSRSVVELAKRLSPAPRNPSTCTTGKPPWFLPLSKTRTSPSEPYSRFTT
jgi:hypothetical protein